MVQAIGLAVTPLIFYWLVLKDDTLVTLITLVVIWIFQILYLLYYVRKTNREIAGFLNSIVHKDTSQKYDTDERETSFKDLYRSFNEIFKSLREARIEKEAEHHYFLNTIKHLAIGLISFNEDGKIELFNRTASEILKIKSPKNINDISQANMKIGEMIHKVRPNNSELVKTEIDGEVIQLSVNAVAFKIETRNIKLISLQDIKSEIEAGEVDAWQKLIRVLIHEITNSISPINLLSSTLLNVYKPGGQPIETRDLKQKAIDDSIVGLEAIKKRSAGLKRFIESYSSFTKVPKPNFSSFSIQILFNNLTTLFKDELQSIEFRTGISPPEIILYADEKMVEQVLINLVNNSIYFLKGIKGAMIELSAFKKQEKTVIQVWDNGPGIIEDEMDNIFVPFYSTKESGSGIGLSLSKQIMILNKGTISVISKPGIKTVFSLHF